MPLGLIPRLSAYKNLKKDFEVDRMATMREPKQMLPMELMLAREKAFTMVPAEEVSSSKYQRPTTPATVVLTTPFTT